MSFLPNSSIEKCIYLVRGHRVMLDADLANLYQVPLKRLNQQVRRNTLRFPEDFLLQLSLEEEANLKSQIASSRLAHGGKRKPSFAFTQEGVAMLSSVLRSERAIQVNIAIMRAFVRLREMAAAHADLARRLDNLERKYDGRFRVVFDAIRQLMDPPALPPKRKIGF